jgi:cysteinyl-tRNA synthetase
LALIEKVEQRQSAKAAKDFALADALRQEIEAEGWEIRDTPQGPQLRRRVEVVG